VQFSNGLGKLHGPFVGKVIARYRSDDDVLESQFLGYLGDVAGLMGIDLNTTTNFDGTEATTARACVAQNHESRGLLAPTLWKVWTPGTFADGVQVFSPHHRLDFFNRVGPWQPNR